jgi:hypothetical protein
MAKASSGFGSIPEYEPIAGGGGRGPGINYEGDDDLKVIKTPELEDLTIAVMGFVILPSQYTPDDGSEAGDYCSVHIRFETGEEFLWRTSAKAILRKLETRWENDQIPFRTKVVSVPNKRGTRTYLDFTN